jgi:Holliday junction resolvase RusA-like endonuclease
MKRIYIPGIPDVKVRPRFTKNGHAYDPNAQQKEASIQKAEISGDDHIYAGPVDVEFIFVFPRPKSHYRTGKNSSLLRDNAPKYCLNKKDIDNMEKFYSDSFNCIAWADDCQIVMSSAMKRWVWAEEVPHVLIIAKELDNG